MQRWHQIHRIWRRHIVVHCQLTMASLLILISSPQKVHCSPSSAYTAPHPGADEASFQREMAQFAIQELLKLGQGQNGKQEQNQQSNTHILPYSLYKHEMAKIFGQEKENLLDPNRPVIIHLPAYRHNRTSNFDRVPLSTSHNTDEHGHWHSSTSEHFQTAKRPNPIRPQYATKWQRKSGIGTMYSTIGGHKELASEADGKHGTSRLSFHQARPPSFPNWAMLSSAEQSLITRPGSMFRPSSNHNHHQQLIKPIQPINTRHGDDAISGTNQQQQISQWFIKRIPSTAPMPNGNNNNEMTMEEANRRLAPPNSVLIPSAASSASNNHQLLAAPFQHSLPTAPLAGSPFDFLTSAGPNPASSAAGDQSVPNAAILSQLPNPLQFFSQGNTLEQITSLARNLIQMSNGKQDLLSSLTKVIGSSGSSSDSPGSKLTSSAVQAISKSSSKVAAQGETTAKIGENDLVKTLFSSSSSGTNSNGTAEEPKQELALNGSSIALLNGLPAEQRNLLEAAMKNGELDAAQTARALSGESNQSRAESEDTKRRMKIVNAESRLMEWIQQNRPRQIAADRAEPMLGSSDADAGPTIVGTAIAGKLPYYGRYCGSFVEQTNTTRQHNIAGALWAVDERRLLISNFRFQPLDHFENITFWAGPRTLNNQQQDFLPSENGFVLWPAKLDVRTFALRPVQRMPAYARSPIAPINGRRENGTAKPAEREEEDFEGGGGGQTETNQIDGRARKRARRNLYNELYGQLSMGQPTTAPTTSSSSTNSRSTTTTVVPIHFGGTPQQFHMSVGQQQQQQQQQKGKEYDKTGMFQPSTTSSNEMATDPERVQQHRREDSAWSSLEWHGGAQPILLTLPENRLIKTLNWLAVWDHTQRQALALVLIPSSAGLAFQAPSTVQLRPLPASSDRRLQSGIIRVLDTKTIEVTEFSLRTDGMPLWFMVGKEIMPNQNGHIVPIYNRHSATLDCDSLRDFHNETVTLRLPDPLDIKDVFWFSVYSIPRSQSLAHIYLPYNDMQLPPDLLAPPTPQCMWTPPPG